MEFRKYLSWDLSPMRPWDWARMDAWEWTTAQHVQSQWRKGVIDADESHAAETAARQDR